MVDTIDAQDYFDAATALFGVATALGTAHQKVIGSLSGTDSMAGTDDKGVEFSNSYDEQASAFESYGRNLIGAVQNYGRVLRQAGINHANAEADSNINGAKPPQPSADPGAAIVACYAIPKSAGGATDGLMENIGLLQKVGVPVPNGDTDKLAKAETAWSSLSGLSSGFTGKISAAKDKIDGLNGEEIDTIVEDLEELDGLVENYTELGTALKDACSQHKDYLNELRTQVEDLLKSLAIDLAVTATIGIISSFVSFGAGGAIAGGKALATIARYGNKIREVISTIAKTKKLKRIGEFFSGLRGAQSNSKMVRFLRMELQQAKTQGARNNIRGRIGELKAGIDPNKAKTTIRINNRDRIPDDLNPTTMELTEVKNTNTIGKTKQIQDMLDYSQQNGYTMKLIVDTRTKISGPLDQLVQSGQIKIIRMDLN
ncbi:putative toxin [Mycobacteroides abscessus]|uniref:putative toxin n=1 Tax=Mycobacteroides abscessus TaxID=36809 RepID=UPI00031E231F|nr:putative toxin [Mycobacteroides abscessus]